MLSGPAASVELSDEEYHLIRDLVFEYCGIFLPDNIRFLVERRLRPRLPVHGLSSFRDYYRMVRYGRNPQAELDEILDRITTNETYFFRGESQLNAFSKEILPTVLDERPPGSTIRLWSAGCSSGEEAYTIAMLLADVGRASEYKFEIFGNDISRKVIRLAREGIYRRAAFRQTDTKYIERYFSQTDEYTYKLDDSIRNRVRFGHLNLMNESSIALLSNMDIVFCRNVMIYFIEESRKKLLDILLDKMRPGGFLILGHSESLINVSTGFELAPLTHDIVYRKPGGDDV